MPNLRYPTPTPPIGASAAYLTGSGQAAVDTFSSAAPGDSNTANPTSEGGDAETTQDAMEAAAASATAAASSATAAAASAVAAASSATAAAASATTSTARVAAFVDPATATADAIATALINAGLMAAS